jgi:hypothetical protein
MCKGLEPKCSKPTKRENLHSSEPITSMINSSPNIFSKIWGLLNKTAGNNTQFNVSQQRAGKQATYNEIQHRVGVKEHSLIPLTILNIMWRPSMFSRSSQILKTSISFWKKSCCAENKINREWTINHVNLTIKSDAPSSTRIQFYSLSASSQTDLDKTKWYAVWLQDANSTTLGNHVSTPISRIFTKQLQNLPPITLNHIFLRFQFNTQTIGLEKEEISHSKNFKY